MSNPTASASSSRRPNQAVFFYLPERQALGGVDPLTLDPDTDWKLFGTGMYAWILQTFLRLKKAGASVRLVATPPEAGLVVVHADQFQRVLSEARSPSRLTVVAVRADRAPQPLADFEVVQNAASADRYRFFIPFWLQPGLVPRNPERGARVENVAYLGDVKTLHPDLKSADWGDALRQRGLNWDCRGIEFSGNDRVYQDLRWHDYSSTDVVVALRPSHKWETLSKPASKLQNAWAAGVPAILSPETQYREVRRSRLDYLEARSSTEALAAVDALRSDPALYSAMVEHGRERAREFQPERLVTRWTDVLWRMIPERADTHTERLFAKARRCRALARRLNALAFGPSREHLASMDTQQHRLP